MPGLRAAVVGRLHEELVVVELQVVGAKQIGDHVDQPVAEGVLTQHLVVACELVHLAHRGGAVLRAGAGGRERRFQLYILPVDGDARARGDQIDALGEAHDRLRFDQILHDQEAVAAKVGELAFRQHTQTPHTG